MDTVAEQTKISTRYLHAIETENFQELPSGLFRRSFIRQYAQALGLNYEEMEPEIEELFGTPETSRNASAEPVPSPGRAITVDPMPTPGGRHDRGHKTAWAAGLLIFALAACSGIYALWERTQRVQAHEDMMQASPAVQTPQETQPKPSAPAPTQTEPAPPVAQSTPPAPAPAPQTGAAATPQSTPPAPAPVASAVPPGTGKINIQVSAIEQAWVRLTSDGKTVFAGVLEPAQTKSFEGMERAKILVGNAGGIDVRWNGKPIGAVGPRGQVRTLEFTPESYLILSPQQQQ